MLAKFQLHSHLVLTYTEILRDKKCFIYFAESHSYKS